MRTRGGGGGARQQQPLGDTRRSPWTPDVQAFPTLGSHSSRSSAAVDFARLSVPVVSGIQFSAVAEVHSSAMDLVDDTLVVRTH